MRPASAAGPPRTLSAGDDGAGVHLSGYQARDWDVVDYHMQELTGTGLMMRGPFPSSLHEKGGYAAFLGAAQTFGCFCETPFPEHLAERLGIPALNLGYGGAGPEFFSGRTALLDYVNNARFAVLQVTSARSQSNSHYEADGLEYVRLRADGRRLGAHAAFDEMALGPATLGMLPLPRRAKKKLVRTLSLPKPGLRALVQEVQEEWVRSNLKLLEQIDVPVILLWFSVRAPAYRQRYGAAEVTLGDFPHLVTPAMLDRLKPHVAAYAECTSRRGLPQPLISRFTGKPVDVLPARDREDLGGARWRANPYYPSPQMHEDAADALEAVLEQQPARFGLL